jgi:hypothetical protein
MVKLLWMLSSEKFAYVLQRFPAQDAAPPLTQ